jgi:dCMP deaminase
LEPDRHLKSDESEKFHEYLKNTYRGIDNEMDGKPCSFCFKSAYNNFKGENNQVHTRSLHAEENAMLQISKKGGVGINKGKLFTTASPCELCAKKAYQLGIKEIYYIDPYPGISRQHVFTNNKATDPRMYFFQGFVGRSFHKLYEPFMAYKDEINLISGKRPKESTKSKRELLSSMLPKDLEKKTKNKLQKISEGEVDDILEKIGKDLENKMKSK